MARGPCRFLHCDRRHETSTRRSRMPRPFWLQIAGQRGGNRRRVGVRGGTCLRQAEQNSRVHRLWILLRVRSGAGRRPPSPGGRRFISVGTRQMATSGSNLEYLDVVRALCRVNFQFRNWKIFRRWSGAMSLTTSVRACGRCWNEFLKLKAAARSRSRRR